MAKKHYNGEEMVVIRHFDSLKNYVGKNAVYPAGDVLHISTKNNDAYDLVITADGVSTFSVLMENAQKKGLRIASYEHSGDTLIINITD